jgi:hypothetical protein
MLAPVRRNPRAVWSVNALPRCHFGEFAHRRGELCAVGDDGHTPRDEEGNEDTERPRGRSRTDRTGRVAVVTVAV